MQKLLSIILLIAMLFCFVACEDDSEYDWVFEKQDTDSEELDESEKSENNKWGISVDGDITVEKAEEISQALIGKYNQFCFLGTCCVGEYNYNDMSEFLTESQKSNYNYAQCKIECCDSVEDAKDHALSYFYNDHYMYNFAEENFFYDDQENLYVFFTPIGFEEDGGKVFTIDEFSNDRIVASETAISDKGWKEITEYMIAKKDGKFVIDVIMLKREMTVGTPTE